MITEAKEQNQGQTSELECDLDKILIKLDDILGISSLIRAKCEELHKLETEEENKKEPETDTATRILSLLNLIKGQLRAGLDALTAFGG